MRRELEHLDIPGEHEARERTWQLVSSAFGEREPAAARRARRLVPALAVVLAGAVVAAVVGTSSGRALVHSIRKSIGVEKAQPALFSLPTAGRLLVASDAGVWIVQADGEKRLLGRYREASWSPHGRFVVAARANELAALEPDGHVRWTLSRPDVRFPRWTGTNTDTRIAYLTTSRLHVLGGDGKGDLDAGGLPAAGRVAPSWRPGPGFVLAYVSTKGRVYAYDAGRGSDFWSVRPVVSAPFPGPRLVEWSTDGKRLLLVTRDKVALFGVRSAAPVSVRFERVADAAFRPQSHEVAVIRRPGEVSQLVIGGKVLFSTAGRLSGIAWSPDGRWALVGLPDADQWVFVRADGRKIVAVSNVSAQFRSQTFPRVAGWSR